MTVNNFRELNNLLDNLLKERESILEVIKTFVDSRSQLKNLSPENAEKIIYSLRDSYDACNNNIKQLTNLIHAIKTNIDKEPSMIKPVIENKAYQAISKKEKQNYKSETKENYKENTLLITNTKVILPFVKSDLEKLLKHNKEKYDSIQDIIDKEYTLPGEIYNNSTSARFKEAYKLMKDRQKATIKESFDLAMELMPNYNLHPAIITACKNLDELDIYLDYLENGEQQKFDIFNIEFEISPKKSNTKKKNSTSKKNNNKTKNSKPKKKNSGKHSK